MCVEANAPLGSRYLTIVVVYGAVRPVCVRTCVAKHGRPWLASRCEGNGIGSSAGGDCKYFTLCLEHLCTNVDGEEEVGERGWGGEGIF